MQYQKLFKNSYKALKGYLWETKLNEFVEHFLLEQSIENITAEIIKLRTDAFQLEAYGRILRNSKDNDLAIAGSQLRLAAKGIEDCLGRFLYYVEMFELTQIKSKKILSDAKSDVIIASLELMTELPEFQKQLSIIKKCLSQTPQDFAVLRKHYLKGARKELKKIHNKIIDEIDSNLLEDGTHKLRRLIRWVIMYFIYPQGLFGFEDKTLAETSKYLNLSPSSMNDPIMLDYWMLKKLSDFVGQLGSQKDEGLFQHYLHSLKGHTVDINISDKKTIELTKSIIQQIQSKEIILKLRKFL